MSENSSGSRRRNNWILFWTAVSAIAAVATFFVGLDLFSDSGGSETTAKRASNERPEEPGGTSDPNGTKIPQAGEELWSSEISLAGEELYALDDLPIEPYPSLYCTGCLKVNTYLPGASLEVENGIREWGGSSPPSYEDCVRLLESGPALVISLTSSGGERLDVGEWACAFSLSGNLLRLRYEGETGDEANQRFAATSWVSPF